MNKKALFTIFMIVLTGIIGFGIIIPLLVPVWLIYQWWIKRLVKS